MNILLLLKYYNKDDANSDVIALRAVRFLRILKLFTHKSYLGRFLNFINKSLKDLFIFSILLGFFIVIFALTGREFFSNKIRIRLRPDRFNYIYPSDVPPRENFDSIPDSIITVFILFIGDVINTLFFYLLKFILELGPYYASIFNYRQR